MHSEDVELEFKIVNEVFEQYINYFFYLCISSLKLMCNSL